MTNYYMNLDSEGAAKGKIHRLDHLPSSVYGMTTIDEDAFEFVTEQLGFKLCTVCAERDLEEKNASKWQEAINWINDAMEEIEKYAKMDRTEFEIRLYSRGPNSRYGTKIYSTRDDE